MKVFLTLWLVALLLLFTGCDKLLPTTGQQEEEQAEEIEVEQEEALPTGKPYIAVILNEKDGGFWQTVAVGAEDASNKYGADFICDSPKTDAEEQSDVLERVLSKNPSAVCIAVPDAEVPDTLLERAQREGVCLVALNPHSVEALPGAFAGAALTDSFAAGDLAAASMFGSHFVVEKVRNASAASPVTIVVLSGDDTADAADQRIRGFLNKAMELINGVNQSSSQITGVSKYAAPMAGVAVNIEVVVPQSTDKNGLKAAAQSVLQHSTGLIGVFCAGQDAAEGLLAAASDGQDLDRTRGIYKDLTVIGFDAGEIQKEAVRRQYFYGAVTQDPYNLGYLSAEIAYNALQGDAVPRASDSGSKFYNHENMDKKDMARLLYD